jgi:hypothetical protein
MVGWSVSGLVLCTISQYSGSIILYIIIETTTTRKLFSISTRKTHHRATIIVGLEFFTRKYTVIVSKKQRESVSDNMDHRLHRHGHWIEFGIHFGSTWSIAKQKTTKKATKVHQLLFFILLFGE